MSASGRRKPVQSTRYLSSNLFHFIGGVTEKYKHRVHDLSGVWTRESATKNSGFGRHLKKSRLNVKSRIHLQKNYLWFNCKLNAKTLLSQDEIFSSADQGAWLPC